MNEYRAYSTFNTETESSLSSESFLTEVSDNFYNAVANNSHFYTRFKLNSPVLKMAKIADQYKSLSQENLDMTETDIKKQYFDMRARAIALEEELFILKNSRSGTHPSAPTDETIQDKKLENFESKTVNSLTRQSLTSNNDLDKLKEYPFRNSRI